MSIASPSGFGRSRENRSGLRLVPPAAALHRRTEGVRLAVMRPPAATGWPRTDPALSDGYQREAILEFKPYEAALLLLTTIGPLRVTIVCATMTADASAEFVRTVAARSVKIASIVCIVFALLGEAILGIFQVSLPAFQIGGGIIVLLFSLEMAMRDKSEKAGAPAAPSLDIAAYPLAVPLMASVSGLVAIVTLIAEMGRDLRGIAALSGLILAIMALNYVCIRSSRFLVVSLGPATLQVVAKIMGTILVALAIELIHKGALGFGLVPVPPG